MVLTKFASAGWVLLASLADSFLAVAMSANNTLACYAFFGQPQDMGWTFQQNVARARVDETLGTRSEYVSDFAFMSNEQRNLVIDKFVHEKNCAIIFMGSGAFLFPSGGNATVTWSDIYPQTRFFTLGATAPWSRAGGAQTKIYQASYVAGVIAAMQPLNSGGQITKLGYVGSTYMPDSLLAINAFYLGATSVNAHITLTVTHVGNWYQPREEYIAVERLVKQHGVQILAYDSDSRMVMERANQLGVFSFGMKSDGTAMISEMVLSNQILLWETVLTEAVELVLAGDEQTWAAGKDKNQFVGFEKGAVSLGTLSSHLRGGSVERATALRKMFASGNDPVFCQNFTTLRNCPPGASETTWVQRTAQALIFPCDNTSVQLYPCLSVDDRQSLVWLLKGITDMGLQKVPEICQPGTYIDPLDQRLCVPCAAGKFTSSAEHKPFPYQQLDPYMMDCQDCRPGYFTDSELSTDCEPCSPGTFTAGYGSTVCDVCPGGTYSNVPAASECDTCRPGTSQPNLSATSEAFCILCERGKFSSQRAATRCVGTCPEGQSTLELGSASLADCVCEEGSYAVLGSTLCSTCPEGAMCVAGSTEANIFLGTQPAPSLLEGFMSFNDNPLSIYRCFPPKFCPNGKCGELRDINSVACGDCVQGSYLKEGKCVLCAEADMVPMYAAIIASLIVAMIATYTLNRSLVLMSRSTLTIVSLFSVGFTSVQTMSMYGSLNMSWFEPLGAILQVTSLLNFNISVLKGACVVGSNPVVSIAVRQSIAPLAIPVVGCMIMVKKCWNPRIEAVAEFSNTLGTIAQIFFISIVLSASTPFVCYEHPNGKRSIVATPSILCDDGAAYANVVALAVSVFVLVAFPLLSFTAYGTYMYPRLVNNKAQARYFTHASFRFLYAKFRPNCHYYSVFMMLRSLAICFTPIVVINDVAAQLVVVCIFLLAAMIAQIYLLPWLSAVVNLADGTITAVLIIILFCGGMQGNLHFNADSLQGLGTAALALVCVVWLISSIYAFYQRFLPRPWYQMFLCHHKRDAAGQVRLLKILLEARTNKSVFLDSDDLVDLHTLFDVVKTQVRELIVYLTRDVLSRPWCAGEIATAFAKQLQIRSLLIPGFTFPTTFDLLDMTKFLVFDGALQTLEAYYLPDQLVRDAILNLARNTALCIKVEDVGPRGTWRFPAMVDALVWGHPCLELPHTTAYPPIPCIRGSVLISADSADWEAVAAAGILASKITARVRRFSDAGVHQLSDYQEDDEDLICPALTSARATLFILSKGSLLSTWQLSLMKIASMLMERALVTELSMRHMVTSTSMAIDSVNPILLMIKGFHFPDASYYDNQILTVIRAQSNEAARLDTDRVRNFFNCIAITWSIEDSDAVLSLQAAKVLRRIPTSLDAALSPLSFQRRFSLASVGEPVSPISIGPLDAPQHSTTAGTKWYEL